MAKVIQLSEICVSLEEAQHLNNTVDAAHAWVWNPHKHTEEFELRAVEKTPVDAVAFTRGMWEIWPGEIFVQQDQIDYLIEKGHFFFAPLK